MLLWSVGEVSTSSGDFPPRNYGRAPRLQASYEMPTSALDQELKRYHATIRAFTSITAIERYGHQLIRFCQRIRQWRQLIRKEELVYQLLTIEHRRRADWRKRELAGRQFSRGMTSPECRIAVTLCSRSAGVISDSWIGWRGGCTRPDDLQKPRRVISPGLFLND